MIPPWLLNLVYLAAAVCFILGLKRLGSPATARRGNQIAAVGMLVAVVATLLGGQILSPAMIAGGVLLGSAIGVVAARRVRMTAMPEMVAALNGLGGAASVLVAAAEIARYAVPDSTLALRGLEPLGATLVTTVLLSVAIGSVTFSGSVVAFGKLSGRFTGNPIAFPGMRPLTVLLGAAVLGGFAYALWTLGAPVDAAESIAWVVGAVALLALVLGVLLVIPIGGADMPVVVALLNSYSGIAAAATGFVLGNYALIVSGALVGASGIILSKIMCDAMNRSLLNVLLGGFGGGGAAHEAEAEREGRSHRATSADDAAVLLGYANQVVIVPGYGLAVAQAQHIVRELSELLQRRGVAVKFAIHPVAGRMPGHMNVLLAEANVPYDQLFDMEEINDDFERTDVALVVGANDVVNPAARNDPASPIYGMPILNVDRAQNVIVLKRSMAAGYAGVENELFFLPGTAMLFGDAKQSLGELVTEVKQL